MRLMFRERALRWQKEEAEAEAKAHAQAEAQARAEDEAQTGGSEMHDDNGAPGEDPPDPATLWEFQKDRLHGAMNTTVCMLCEGDIHPRELSWHPDLGAMHRRCAGQVHGE